MSKRIKVTLQTGDVRGVVEMLKRRYPYLTPSAAANLILLEAAGIVDAMGARVTRSHPESPGVTRGAIPSPDPARTLAPARVDDVSQSVSQSGEFDIDTDHIAQLISSLPWYGAELPKRSTPEKMAARLQGSYPKLTAERIAEELHRASGWLEDHSARRKKQLGSYLMSWLKTASNGGHPRRSNTTRQRGFALPDTTDSQWMEGTDNARFED